ncbi:carboxypeptidase regulatory-like domain-containing protein [Agromyces sp. SYSU T0242]|uniref:carboxypeptidase regulatory-like domain-containing protein n=1 Tax=Agromyces litoreus TaxID=3158561 RepID=UPI003399A9BA
MRAAARPIGLAAAIALLAALLTSIGLSPASAEDTGSISGTVTNTHGEPLEGALVVAFFASNLYGYSTAASTRTDAQGRYTVTGLGARDYGIRAWGPDGTEYASVVWDGTDPYATATVISLGVGEAREGIYLRLPTAGIVTGVVTDVDGAPIAGASVVLTEKVSGGTPRSYGDTTDESGRYEIRRLDPGRWSASFRGDAVPTSTETGYVPITGVTVEVLGDAVVELDMTMTAAVVIRGTVTDQRGDPIRYMNVSLYAFREGRWMSIADGQTSGTESASGRFAFSRLPAGTYTVQFWSSNGKKNYETQWWRGKPGALGNVQPEDADADTIELASGESMTADVRIADGATIQGTVTDQAGALVQSQWVMAYRLRAGEWWPFATGPTGADGTFRLSGLAAGTYVVQFRERANLEGEWWQDGTSLETARRFEVAAGEVVSGVDASVTRRSVSMAAPTLSGSAVVGSTLRAEVTSDTPKTTFAYEWLADGAPVPGVVESTLPIGPELVGRAVSVRVTASAPEYVSTTSETPSTGPVALGALEIGAPSISGDPVVRRELVAEPGAWTSGTSFDYQWFADDAPIPGATSAALVPTASLVGVTVSVRITGSKDGYRDVSVIAVATSLVAFESGLPMATRPAEPVSSAPPRIGVDEVSRLPGDDGPNPTPMRDGPGELEPSTMGDDQG